jgi:hypothetical protein
MKSTGYFYLHFSALPDSQYRLHNAHVADDRTVQLYVCTMHMWQTVKSQLSRRVVACENALYFTVAYNIGMNCMNNTLV